MPRSAKASLLLPVLIVLLLGAVVADIVRRAVGHAPTEAVAPAAVPAHMVNAQITLIHAAISTDWPGAGS